MTDIQSILMYYRVYFLHVYLHVYFLCNLHAILHIMEETLFQETQDLTSRPAAFHTKTTKKYKEITQESSQPNKMGKHA